MQLTADLLKTFPAEDAMLLHSVDTAFFPKRPDRIAVAASGGGDSMALLYAFASWGRITGLPVEAVSVDHGLRAETGEEIALVADLCAHFRIDHSVLRWEGWDGSGNLQAAARAARYALIADWAKGRGIGGIALGHTRDDIAETFLMRLARKSGIEGLAAMDPRFERYGLKWVRPFWQQSRTDLREYLKRHDQTWAEDPSNSDPRYDRVRARAALDELAKLGIDAEVLHHSAFALYMANSALDHYTALEAVDHIVEDRGDVILKHRPPLSEEIKRRLLNAALRNVGGAPYPPRWMALTEMEASLSTTTRATLAGCLITEEPKSLRITREYNSVRETYTSTQEVWDGRWQLDGPHAPDLRIGALGDAVKDCPEWRATGLPRDSLRASPAVWRGDTLVAAPLAGYNPNWSARIVAPFADFLNRR